MKSFSHVIASLHLAALQVFNSHFASSAQGKTGRVPLYRNPAAPVEKRVKDLLRRMSLDEKVAQMQCVWNGKNEALDDAGRFDPLKAEKAFPHGIGHMARPSDNTERKPAGVTRDPRETVELVNAVQRFMIEKTRLGIPVMFHEEGLHGYQAKDATQFPQAIALASTWNPELVEEVYSVVGREIRCRGVYQVLSPVVDVARDPRWGRTEETFGEDPFLVSAMGLAAVKGFQGTGLPLASDKVLVSLKHLTGHGQPESGTNTGPAPVPPRMLREIFFPPFELAVRQGGALCVMASYNEIDGIPSHANRFLLTDVLRGEWGFDGFVIADYDGIFDLMTRHHVAGTPEAAAMQALEAGVDVELPDRKAYRLLPGLVSKGILSESQVDRSVSRVLRAKFLSGIFEHPYADGEVAEELTGNGEARELALRAAHQSIVLLKNEKRLLPLDLARCTRIAVVGPNAAETPLGGYSGVPRKTVSILDGIRDRAGSGVAVDFAQGVRITQSRNWYNDHVQLADAGENLRSIEKAVEVVKGADCAIVAIGGNEETCREGWADNHPGDRSSLDLVGEQETLVRAIVATGVPAIVVLINGRPLSINYIAEKVPAVLECWYLGQETGTAVADILFGIVNPGGKLPLSIPRSAGQLPMFYNRKPSARRAYLFGSTEPLFPFGYGLSYTTFRFENLRLARAEIAASENTEVLVDVINTGDRPGDETVQLYLRDLIGSVTRPVAELKGFRRITLEKGESRTVTLPLTPDHLSMYNREMKRVVEPGEFEIRVGPNSVEGITTVLKVKKARKNTIIGQLFFR